MQMGGGAAGDALGAAFRDGTDESFEIAVAQLAQLAETLWSEHWLSSGTLSCFWVSILPTIWPEVIGGFQA